MKEVIEVSAKVLASTENMSYEDCLEHRKLGIGGSDASVVCGINRYKSAVELWMDKTGQLPYREAGEAAYWGTQLEPFVRAEFTKRTGIEVRQLKQLLQSEEHPFMLVNLDGVCEVPDFSTCIFEAKTASAYKAGEWEDSIPDEYQLHTYCTDLARAGVPLVTASKLMGHSNVSITAKIYTHVDQDMAVTAVAKLNDFYGGSGDDQVTTRKSV